MKLLENFIAVLGGIILLIFVIALILLCPIIIVASIAWAVAYSWVWIFGILLISIPIAIIKTIYEWSKSED